MLHAYLRHVSCASHGRGVFLGSPPSRATCPDEHVYSSFVRARGAAGMVCATMPTAGGTRATSTCAGALTALRITAVLPAAARESLARPTRCTATRAEQSSSTPYESAAHKALWRRWSWPVCCLRAAISTRLDVTRCLACDSKESVSATMAAVSRGTAASTPATPAMWTTSAPRVRKGKCRHATRLAQRLLERGHYSLLALPC